MATSLRWLLLSLAFVLMTAFLVTAVRAFRAGSRLEEIIEVMESRWFDGTEVLAALAVGLVGSWAATYVGGSRAGLGETAGFLFPLGIVSAFAACRLPAGGQVSATLRKLLPLGVTPLLLGAVLTGW